MNEQVFKNLWKWQNEIECVVDNVSKRERLIQRASWDVKMAYNKGLITLKQAKELNNTMCLGLVL